MIVTFSNIVGLGVSDWQSAWRHSTKIAVPGRSSPQHPTRKLSIKKA